MVPRVVLPWFLPLSGAVAFACSRVALRLHRGEGRKTGQALVLTAIGWYPLLVWFVAQFLSTFTR